MLLSSYLHIPFTVYTIFIYYLAKIGVYLQQRLVTVSPAICYFCSVGIMGHNRKDVSVFFLRHFPLHTKHILQQSMELLISRHSSSIFHVNHGIKIVILEKHQGIIQILFLMEHVPLHFIILLIILIPACILFICSAIGDIVILPNILTKVITYMFSAGGIQMPMRIIAVCLIICHSIHGNKIDIIYTVLLCNVICGISSHLMPILCGIWHMGQQNFYASALALLYHLAKIQGPNCICRQLDLLRNNIVIHRFFQTDSCFRTLFR